MLNRFIYGHFFDANLTYIFLHSFMVVLCLYLGFVLTFKELRLFIMDIVLTLNLLIENVG